MELLNYPFYATAFVLVIAALLGAIGLWLRQPLIVAFIAVGILVGPSALGWITPTEEIELLAELGIALLLFVKTWDADLIVVGSHGRKGLSEMLLGSVSNYVVHHAPCSVIIVHGQIE